MASVSMSGNDAINFMSGSPLNRLSWLRNSSKFINAASLSPSARWLLFRAGDPLVHKQSGRPVELPTKRIEHLLGPTPYFGHGKREGEVQDPTEETTKGLASARIRGPTAIFLGFWEGKGGDDAVSAVAGGAVKGDAYFALDVSKVEQEALDRVQSTADQSESELVYTPARLAVSRFDKQYAAIYASAKAMIEWNSRINFCGSCGSPVYSLWAGWKLACSSLLPWSEPREPPCPTTSGLHAHQYPRTDTAIIVGIIDQSGDKILLGRNKKFPGLFYSTLAGFVEPGETFEEAVAREIYEESGVKVHDVAYHSTQPWPYPGNLMVGFYARADSTKPLNLELDTELSDTKWFTRAEVQEVLSHPDGTNLAARDNKQLDSIVSGKTTDPATSQAVVGVEEAVLKNQPPFRVPPISSVAGVLISEWVYGKAKL